VLTAREHHPLLAFLVDDHYSLRTYLAVLLLLKGIQPGNGCLQCNLKHCHLILIVTVLAHLDSASWPSESGRSTVALRG